MDPQLDSVPDDVWIMIFECLSSPADWFNLTKTCHRFSPLASRQLLRDLAWRRPESTNHNLEAWKSNPIYSMLVGMPRKLTIQVEFDFVDRHYWPYINNSMRLHDKVYAQVLNFPVLHELVLCDTVISPYIYSILAALPKLRSLSIVNCDFIYLYTSFHENMKTAKHNFHYNPNPRPFDFTTLSLTHLRLHTIRFLTEPPPGFFNDNNPYHPLHLITVPNLRSVSLMWTPMHATIYRQRQWALPSVDNLEIIIPFLTSDLEGPELPILVSKCHAKVRVSLEIPHNKRYGKGPMTSNIRLPLEGVHKYKGPLSFPNFGPHGRVLPGLTDLVMTQVADLPVLFSAFMKLSTSIRSLDIEIPQWNLGPLYAVQDVFPNICSLVVRYHGGVLPVNFFATVGAGLLLRLRHLHTLKLLSCEFRPTSRRSEINAEEDQQKKDMNVYFQEWSKYCTGSLRLVQVKNFEKSCRWEREFDGDPWVQVGY